MARLEKVLDTKRPQQTGSSHSGRLGVIWKQVSFISVPRGEVFAAWKPAQGEATGPSGPQPQPLTPRLLLPSPAACRGNPFPQSPTAAQLLGLPTSAPFTHSRPPLPALPPTLTPSAGAATLPERAAGAAPA